MSTNAHLTPVAAGPANDYHAIDPADAEHLADEISELCAYIHVATAHLIEMLREFDENKYWGVLGFRSCVEWLSFKCGLGPCAAREHLRVAHALPKLPKTRDRFAEGALSYSKVRAITRAAKPETEDFLLMVAHHGTASHIERLASQIRRCEKLQNPDAAQQQYLGRSVTCRYDDDGCLVIKGKMPADMGEVIVKALDRVLDERFREARAAGDQERKPIAAERADALCEIAETFLNNPENAGSTADRYQVVVHVNRDAVGGSSAGDRARLENGPVVSAETSERLSCDCSTYTIDEDEDGEPLNIGRRSRTIPPAIRRALKARDGGCRFPGCSSYKFCDGHHIRHWSDGGETSLDKLVLLCRFHHHLVHEGGYDCKRSKDGEIYFEDKRAQRLREFHEAPRVSVEETLAWMYRKYKHHDVYPEGTLSAETSMAHWYAGEKMDMEYAVWVAMNIRAPN